MSSIQDSLRKNKSDFTKSDLFRGPLDLSDGNISKLNPYIGGRGFIIFTKMPRFMEMVQPEQTKQFKAYVEKAFKNFDGIGDVSGEEKEMGDGTQSKMIKIYTDTNDQFDGFTLTLQALKGSPIRAFVEDWMNGIIDKESKRCTYLGKIDDGTIPEQDPKYHTASAIYFTVDPTGTKVEYACGLKMIKPTNAPKGHLNTQKGQHDFAELSVQFSAIKRENKNINKMALNLLKEIEVEANSYNLDNPL